MKELMSVDAKNVDWATKENMFSFLKLAAAFVAYPMIGMDNIGMATLMILAFVVFDMMDGLLARQRPLWTPENDIKRRKFDNICDTFVPSIICVRIFQQVGVSLWWLAPLITREAMIALLAIIALRHARVVVFPNVAHKAAKLLLALAGIMVLNQWYGERFLIIAYTGLYITMMDYWGLFKALIPQSQKTDEPLRGFRPAVLVGLAFYMGLIKDPMIKWHEPLRLQPPNGK